MKPSCLVGRDLFLEKTGRIRSLSTFRYFLVILPSWLYSYSITTSNTHKTQFASSKCLAKLCRGT